MDKPCSLALIFYDILADADPFDKGAVQANHAFVATIALDV